MEYANLNQPTSSSLRGRRLAWLGYAIVLGAIGPLGVWISMAELSMAVVAPAFVKVDLTRRRRAQARSATI